MNKDLIFSHGIPNTPSKQQDNFLIIQPIQEITTNLPTKNPTFHPWTTTSYPSDSPSTKPHTIRPSYFPSLKPYTIKPTPIPTLNLSKYFPSISPTEVNFNARSLITI